MITEILPIVRRGPATEDDLLGLIEVVADPSIQLWAGVFSGRRFAQRRE